MPPRLPFTETGAITQVDATSDDCLYCRYLRRAHWRDFGASADAKLPRCTELLRGLTPLFPRPQPDCPRLTSNRKEPRLPLPAIPSYEPRPGARHDTAQGNRH